MICVSNSKSNCLCCHWFIAMSASEDLTIILRFKTSLNSKSNQFSFRYETQNLDKSNSDHVGKSLNLNRGSAIEKPTNFYSLKFIQFPMGIIPISNLNLILVIILTNSLASAHFNSSNSRLIQLSRAQNALRCWIWNCDKNTSFGTKCYTFVYRMK